MNLQPLLSPATVALIGASNKEGSLGYDMVKMIKKGGYTGEIFPVNPRYEEVCGIKCYPDIVSIGKPVDTAAFCINAKRMEEQVTIALEAGVKSLIVFANCVLEEDTTPNLEQRLVALCKQYGVPMLGHNAMGYYNNDIGLRICGFEAPDEGVFGNIALISQSGSVFSTIGHNEKQLKFNLMVATGTGHVTSLSDYMVYALEQPTTKVLGVYMESLRKPKRFLEALELASKKRIPVVLMKVGKSALGAKFAQSHTGGLAGDDDAYQAIFDHYGVIRVHSLGEMANTLLLFSRYPNIPQGGLVAIADSGGERNLLADTADALGLPFPELSPETMEKLQAIQEYGQEAANPLDPWGTGLDFEKIFENSLITMLADDNAAIGMISQDLRDGYFLTEGCIGALKNAAEAQPKPVVFMTNLGGIRRYAATEAVNSFGGIVLSETAYGLSAVKHWLNYRDFTLQEAPCAAVNLEQGFVRLLESKKVLQETEALTLLKALGIPALGQWVVNGPADLEAHSFPYPVALKTAAEGVLHKADVGGVKLGIQDLNGLKAAYADMSARLGSACVVTPMMEFDTELILGMKTDDNFGPMVIVGAGGIYTEMLKDRMVLPVTASMEEIKAKLQTLKTYPLLTGFRGSRPADIDRLAAMVKQFCAIAYGLQDYVQEIDINPVAIQGCNMAALDALIICKG